MRAILAATRAAAVAGVCVFGAAQSDAIATQPPPPNASDSFDVVVLGDLSMAQPAMGERAVQAAAWLVPDFVMTTGNVVAPAQNSAEWQASWDAAGELLGSASDNWYPCAGEHELSLETAGAYAAMGTPLWYSFRHKFAQVFVLCSRDPDAPGRLARGQVEWIGNTLAASDARHVLMFVHDALWHEGHAGSNWNEIHAMLVADGRAATVIAGSPSVYRDDGARESVHYYTLGPASERAVGSDQAAYTWAHVTLLRVRPGSATPVVIPLRPDRDSVGVRPSDWQRGEEIDAVRALADDQWVSLEGGVLAHPDQGVVGDFVVSVSNPWTEAVRCSIDTTSSVDVAYSPRRWAGTLEPGASVTVPITAWGGESSLERPRESVRASLEVTMSNGQRQRLTRTIEVPVVLDLPADDAPAVTDPALNGALALDGRSAMEFDAPVGGSFTIEAWVRGDRARSGSAIVSFGARGGGLYWAETESGDPAITAVVPTGSEPAVAISERAWSWDRWSHVAMCVDGDAVRLFINGALHGETAIDGQTEALGTAVFTVGAEQRPVRGRGAWFAGAVDEVRLSDGARYDARFAPERVLTRDGGTVALLHFDSPGRGIGADDSGNARNAWSVGSPEVITSVRE